MEERQPGSRIDDYETVRLGDLRGDLGQMLCPGDADRDGKPKLIADAPPDLGGDLGRRAEQMVSPSDICRHLQSFVDQDALDESRVVVKDRNGRIEDGITRCIGGFQVIDYDIPRRTVAAYYPECKALIPLWQFAQESKTPAAKSVPIRIDPE